MNVQPVRPKGVRGFARKQALRVWARLHEWASLATGGTLNITQVAPQLWVGGAIPKSRYGELKALGVDAIIDMRGEYTDDEAALRALGIEFYRIQVPDHFAATPEQLVEATNWGLSRLLAGKGVFTHCQHGVGRGPLMGVSLLIAQGMNPDDAYAKVREARWQAALNDRQLAGLNAFVDAWHGQKPRAEDVQAATT